MSEIKKIPVKDIKGDPIGEELARSQAMKPYIAFLVAAMRGEDTTEALARIESLPIKERYVARVLAAIRWAFADFDSATLQLDKDTLEPASLKQLLHDEILEIRPAQLAIALKVLLGDAEMERLFVAAIKQAKATIA